MGIKPTHKCVETVFGEKYHLDFYQREYKWGKCSEPPKLDHHLTAVQ